MFRRLKLYRNDLHAFGISLQFSFHCKERFADWFRCLKRFESYTSNKVIEKNNRKPSPDRSNIDLVLRMEEGVLYRIRQTL